MLNNIVDKLEQCWQQNIVHGCFHQARTGCSIFAVYIGLTATRNFRMVRMRFCLKYLPLNISMLHFVCLFVLLGIVLSTI